MLEIILMAAMAIIAIGFIIGLVMVGVGGIVTLLWIGIKLALCIFPVLLGITLFYWFFV